MVLRSEISYEPVVEVVLSPLRKVENIKSGSPTVKCAYRRMGCHFDRHNTAGYQSHEYGSFDKGTYTQMPV